MSLFGDIGRGVEVVGSQIANDPMLQLWCGIGLGFFSACIVAMAVMVLVAFTKGLSKSYYDVPPPSAPLPRSRS